MPLPSERLSTFQERHLQCYKVDSSSGNLVGPDRGKISALKCEDL